ncbi:RNA-binding protein [Halobacteriales archaeon QS_1_68_44]|nr:MAG: RNA-binding protein [Halobacteriales archaeon QS_1_68_44]
MQPRSAENATAVAGRSLAELLQEPELLAGVAVVALLLVALGAFLWRRLSRTRSDRFLAALADREAVAVLMHPNPDPDSMADTDAAIQYAGEIRHSENRAFEAVLDCEFDRIVTDIDLAAHDIVLVDHNEPRGFPGAEGLTPLAVVDHHPGAGEGTKFTDVRPGRGSCAGILAEYLRQQGWNSRNGDRPLPSRLATGLLYGIQSDTTSFTRGCTPAEFDAAAYLFPAADPDALDRNTDALPTAVEELVRLEGVTAAVVTGKRNGTIYISGRSRDDRVHMGNAIDAAVEPFADASGGGHARMGGGQVALADGGEVALSEPTPDDAPGPDLDDRLFAAMRGEL